MPVLVLIGLLVLGAVQLPEPTKRLAYPATEAARVLGVSRTWIYRRMAEGKLRAIKLGGRTMIRREELERILNEAPEWQPDPTMADRLPRHEAS